MVQAAMVHAICMGTHVCTIHVTVHVTAVWGGLLLSIGCSYLCLVASSGGSSIDSLQVHCSAACDKGCCQLWGAAKVQVHIAGEHILPGVALWDCLCARHLQTGAKLTLPRGGSCWLPHQGSVG